MEFWQGLARGICFLCVVLMITAWDGNLPWWTTLISGFFMGVCASFGWHYNEN